MFTKLTLINFILAALFLGFIDSDLRAEPRSNYADVEWFTTETDHFVIHYHQGVEWTARKVTSIADKVYDTVTEEYHYPLKDKVHVVVRDLEDHANGFAVWHLNWITIWATNSTFMLRGRHDWIYGTFVHEFAHIVSLHRSANWNGLIEGMRLGGVTGRSTESNSEFGGTLFLSANPVPRWWAEGAAQLDAADSGDDLFDSNQAMLLRTAVLENNLLNFDELHNIAVRENFSGELVYNQGFDFLRWLRDKFRLDKPEFSQLNLQLALQQAQHKHFDFEKNFQELFGKPARQLYKEWQTEITNNYSQQTAELRKQTVSGEKIRLIDDDDLAKIKDSKERAYKDGIWNFYPRYSPDGHFFSYVSSNLVNVRYLERPYDLTSMQGAGAGKIKTPQPTEVNSPSSWAAESNDAAHESSAALNFAVKGRSYAWSPDSTKMIVSRKVHDLTGGYQYYDLYLLDLSPLKRDKKSSPKVKRLTHQLRAIQPTWSPDGERVVFAKNQDGTIALYISDIEQLSTPHALIDHGAGAQALDPTWSPDGKRLAYTLFRDGDKHNSIWVYDFRTQQSAPLLQGNCEFRDPSWAADGNEIIFSSDLSGIFQIYKVSTQSQAAIAELTPLTNISSGGFYPYLRPDGKELLYSYFSSFGFKLYHLTPQLTPLKSLQLTNAPPSNDAEPVYPIIESSDYRTSFRPARFFPTFIFEDTQFKAGLSAQISDYLEKNNFFASAIFGRDQDYTLSYLNRSWIFDLLATFTRYSRDSNHLILINDNDGTNDEPRTTSSFDVDFVSLALLQHFYPNDFFNGDHELSLSYNLRNVERQVGIPVQLIATDPTSISNSFRLITNHDLTFEWNYHYLADEYDPRNDVNPHDGRTLRIAYSHVWSDLFSVDTSLETPSDSYDFNRVIVNYSEYIPVPRTQSHTLELKFLGGYIDRDVSANDEFFAGGRLNFRAFGDISANSNFSGYEAFSINGETLLLAAANYRFPIIMALNKKVSVFYFDSLYGAIFSEIGNAWNHGETENCQQVPTGASTTCGNGNMLLEDFGAELRLKAFMFNDFNPWNSVARVAYGLQDSADYGFSDDDSPVRFFFGLGTDF